MRGTAFTVERCAAQRPGNVRPLRDIHPGREYLLPGGVQQERCAPILAAAADRTQEVPDETAGQFRYEQYGRSGGCQLARLQPRQGPCGSRAPDLFAVLQLTPVAHRAVP